jgi:hypothetical protein
MAKKKLPTWNNLWAGQEGHTGGGGGGNGGHPGRGQGGGGGNAQPGGWGSNWQSHYPGGGPGGGGGGGGNGGRGNGNGGRGGRRNGRGLLDSGLDAELTQNLKNIEEAMKDADALLVKSYNEGVGSLAEAAANNEKAADTQGFANVGNRARERMNAMSELSAQGAGESDVLRGQGMSLRNWSQNQNEVNRAYHDSLTSTNASLDELTSSTRNARGSNFQDYQNQKQQAWETYNSSKSEAYTQLGNVYGQQAQYYADANEQRPNARSRRRRDRSQRRADRMFMRASDAAWDSRDAKEVPDEIMDWQGAANFENKVTNNNINSMGAGPALNRPEGATLRKWNA